MSRVAKQAHWRKRVLAFERSGLTRRAWCAQEGVAAATLDYWRARIRNLAERSDQSLVPIVVSQAPKTQARPAAASAVEIDLGGGLRLRADAQVDAQWLANVLRGLR
jgi:transposase